MFEKKSLTCSRGYVSRLLFLFSVLFDPASGINECVNPGGNVITSVRGGIMRALPGEDGSFQMGHHCEMASVGAAEAGNRTARTVGVARIGVVGVFENDIIVFEGHGQLETAFAVGYPYTGLQSGKGNRT